MVQLGYAQGVLERFLIQKFIRYTVLRVHRPDCTGQGRSILLYGVGHPAGGEGQTSPDGLGPGIVHL